eukprot:INCI16406.6.p1 GENE.INCI16406.6~~INCI16406.6.p1  ORF type:complete len:951 (-),score=135.14 INCI16406.6:3354-6206(-)
MSQSQNVCARCRGTEFVESDNLDLVCATCGTVFEFEYSQNRAQLEFESQNVAKRFGASVVAYRVRDDVGDANLARNAKAGMTNPADRVPLRQALLAYQWLLRQQLREVCSIMWGSEVFDARASPPSDRGRMARGPATKGAGIKQGLLPRSTGRKHTVALLEDFLGKMWFGFLAKHMSRDNDKASRKMREWFVASHPATTSASEAAEAGSADGSTSTSDEESDSDTAREDDASSTNGGQRQRRNPYNSKSAKIRHRRRARRKHRPPSAASCPLSMQLSLAFLYATLRWHCQPIVAATLLSWVRHGRVTFLRNPFNALPKALRKPLEKSSTVAESQTAGGGIRAFFSSREQDLYGATALVLAAERLVTFIGKDSLGCAAVAAVVDSTSPDNTSPKRSQDSASNDSPATSNAAGPRRSVPILPACNLRAALHGLLGRWLSCEKLLEATLPTPCARARVRHTLVPLALATLVVLQQPNLRPRRRKAGVSIDKDTNRQDSAGGTGRNPVRTPRTGRQGHTDFEDDDRGLEEHTSSESEESSIDQDDNNADTARPRSSMRATEAPTIDLKAPPQHGMRIFGRTTIDSGEAIVAVAAFALLVLLAAVPFIECTYCSNSAAQKSRDDAASTAHGDDARCSIANCGGYAADATAIRQATASVASATHSSSTELQDQEGHDHTHVPHPSFRAFSNSSNATQRFLAACSSSFMGHASARHPVPGRPDYEAELFAYLRVVEEFAGIETRARPTQSPRKARHTTSAKNFQRLEATQQVDRGFAESTTLFARSLDHSLRKLVRVGRPGHSACYERRPPSIYMRARAASHSSIREQLLHGTSAAAVAGQQIHPHRASRRGPGFLGLQQEAAAQVHWRYRRQMPDGFLRNGLETWALAGAHVNRPKSHRQGPPSPAYASLKCTLDRMQRPRKSEGRIANSAAVHHSRDAQRNSTDALSTARYTVFE